MDVNAEFRINPTAASDYRMRGWWRDQIVLDDFVSNAERHPEKTAIHSYHGDGAYEELSYEELLRSADQIAESLLAFGLERGEVVSVQLPNWWQFIGVFLACARTGLVINPILPILRSREVSFIVNRTQSRVWIGPRYFRRFDFGQMLVDLMPETKVEHVIVVGEAEESMMSFEKMLSCHDRSDEPVRSLIHHQTDANSAGQIQFTSGTTGEPKGVVHTYNTLNVNVRAAIEGLEISSDDTMLMASPMAHNTGFMYGMVMPLQLGMTVVLQDVWEPSVAVGLMERHGVTVTMGSTTFATDLCAARNLAPERALSLRLFICGGAPIPPSVVLRVRPILGARLIACWGMTENGIATTTRPSDPEDMSAQSDGRPLPWVKLRVTDEGRRELPSGHSGRLWIQSAGEHVAYLGRPDLYAATMIEGWFDTGDLARISSDGSLRITGRAKDLIIRGGENIPALEVENALLQHPRVHDVAVVGVPDERFGECACAVVVPEDDSDLPGLGDLTAHLEQLGMSRTFWPERLEFRRELPRTETGKVKKFVIREEIATTATP